MGCCENTMAMGRVVCPKPRRVKPSSFYLRNGAEAFNSKLGPALLDSTLCKEGFEAEGCTTVRSSPPFFFGSPPCRAQNPLVQDACFGIQKLGPTNSTSSDSALLQSAHARKKFGNKQAAVRVEGFDCQSSRVVAIAMYS